MSDEVGVIGGVGPAATVCFLDLVVRHTAAGRDQDHVNLVVLQHAAIPDRTAYILGESSDDPGPVMAADARRLEGLGVQFVVVPCNTAHHFTQEVAAAVRIPVLSIVDETVDEVARRIGTGTVGLLATSGTLAAQVYQHAAAARGLATVQPDEDDQRTVMRVIYDQVKAGLPADVDALLAVADRLRARGADAVVLGCTELSVVAAEHDLLGDRTLVDSLDVLARRTVVRAGRPLRD
ncbi:aspartate/glutamate racemase family protein [Cellulomonas oligotrophica]|uniref:Aspartate racemase n=1 Tax=Cellulomonas oligotrophica TaxID=931536 RepID=A0A7Y9FCF5_9CELL|nr:amino acid racemase [Cellulomonas oligotrophica]NYD84584.1 aspartate racemase [Cellulomonas oligotrophica]GIG31650.1 aspartate racemase [Cellulomonas oligotrophica]